MVTTLEYRIWMCNLADTRRAVCQEDEAA